MRRGAPQHPKTKLLAIHLGAQIAHAVGHLEMLWHFVDEYAPAGNVGKWDDRLIALEAGWAGDAGVFVDALVSVGYLERAERYRLIVHDWYDHADTVTHSKVARARAFFTCGRAPRL